jgi:predicted metal-dependent peptidase
LVANPAFTARLSGDDLVFVLAHELLHLALRTHDRARGSNRLEFNYAHDYIINDMLRHALGVTAIPAGGLDMPGAREKSAEEIVVEMRRTSNVVSSRTQVWEGLVTTLDQVLGAARQAAPGSMGDVLDAQRERDLFPDDSENQAERARAIRDLATRSMALAKAVGAMRGRGVEAGSSQQQVKAMRGIYRTPWQLALQTWLEGAAPGERTFTRASRRGNDRSDVVMPGRKRHSWMLNVVLDTSASMSDEVPFALGAIADFCEATGVDEIRLVQCDTVVTSDAVLSPSELADYQISGYGGSDLTPALLALVEDPRVTAALVITDGDIAYPSEPVPYAVLWALPRSKATFHPRYGLVISMGREDAS